MHTTESDGTLSPVEVVQLSKQIGLDVIAITDHDTMKGAQEAMEEGKKQGIRVIPGLEISAGYKGNDTHVLGYGMDYDDPRLEPVFHYVQRDRKKRNLKIAKKMQEDGIIIDIDDVISRPTFGRPHFAKILVEQGYATSISDAFEKYLKEGRQYFLPRTYIPIETAISIIHECGGIAILAHPFQYGYESIKGFLDDIVEMGIDGIEIYYSGYTDKQKGVLLQYAKEKNLLVTGGSDFHGDNKPDIKLGSVDVKCEEFLKRFE